MKPSREYSQETKLVQLGVGVDERTGAISLPIHPSATYRHPGVGESTGYDYTRSVNPTSEVLEEGCKYSAIRTCVKSVDIDPTAAHQGLYYLYV